MSATPKIQPTPCDQLIHLVSGAIPPGVCKTLIQLFEASPLRTPGKVFDAAGKLVVKSDKISEELTIEPEGPWIAPHGALHQQVSQVILGYAALFPSLQIAPLQWSPYKMKKYQKRDGKFDWHFDAASPSTFQRQIALIVYLNNVNKGGETAFFNQQLQITPKEGDVLLFPPFWTHMHSGLIPQSEDKYIITSFVEFAPTSGS